MGFCVMEVKKPATLDEQIDKMTSRGCCIDDRNFAKRVLSEINYYGLTAYFLPFKTNQDTYKPGTTLEMVYNLYKFDGELRMLCFSIIEEIELMLRARLSYYHAHRYGALGYLWPETFSKRHKEKRFNDHIKHTIEKNKKQLFVQHHIDKYGGSFPIWVIIELFSFGELSYFYSDLQTADQKILARRICGSTPKNLSSWLICLTYLRNYCAHYSRLYYTQFPARPATPLNFGYELKKRVFDYLLVLKFLYPNRNMWEEKFLNPLRTIIDKYKKYINLKHIGFPDNWDSLLSCDLDFEPVIE